GALPAHGDEVRRRAQGQVAFAGRWSVVNAYTTCCSDCGEEVAYTDPRRPRKRCKPCRKLFKAAQERERRAEQKAHAESLEQMEQINGRLSRIFEKLMIEAPEAAMVNRLAEIEEDPKWRRVLLP